MEKNNTVLFLFYLFFYFLKRYDNVVPLSPSLMTFCLIPWLQTSRCSASDRKCEPQRYYLAASLSCSRRTLCSAHTQTSSFRLLFLLCFFHQLLSLYSAFSELTLLASLFLCRTRTPMPTSCWRLPSSLPKRASVTLRRSTRPPTSWRTGSKTLFAAWSSARSCWTCLSPSTRTSKRQAAELVGEHVDKSVCGPFVICCRYLMPFYALKRHKIQVMPKGRMLACEASALEFRPCESMKFYSLLLYSIVVSSITDTFSFVAEFQLFSEEILVKRKKFKSGLLLCSYSTCSTHYSTVCAMCGPLSI